MSTPAVRARVAATWRRSCSRLAACRGGSRASRSGLSARPSSWVKTRPVSVSCSSRAGAAPAGLCDAGVVRRRWPGRGRRCARSPRSWVRTIACCGAESDTASGGRWVARGGQGPRRAGLSGAARRRLSRSGLPPPGGPRGRGRRPRSSHNRPGGRASRAWRAAVCTSCAVRIAAAAPGRGRFPQSVTEVENPPISSGSRTPSRLSGPARIPSLRSAAMPAVVSLSLAALASWGAGAAGGSEMLGGQRVQLVRDRRRPQPKGTQRCTASADGFCDFCAGRKLGSPGSVSPCLRTEIGRSRWSLSSPWQQLVTTCCGERPQTVQ
jgi:hypothetical protein